MAAQDQSNDLLMPKATAVWLVENTALTFEQIGAFTGLHAIEVQALADEEVGRGIVGRNPVDNAELMPEELKKAEADPAYQMKHRRSELPTVKTRAKGPKYTPVSRRGDKPDAIAYLLKHHPEIKDAAICKLLGTTKPTIASVRDRSHPNSQNIKPRHPVDLGLCTYAELQAASRRGMKAQGKTDAEIDAMQSKTFDNQEAEKIKPAAAPSQKDPMGGFDFSNFLGKSSGSGSGS